MRTFATWIVLSAAMALMASPAAAAEDPSVHDAQARFEEGLERVKAGDYEAARISFAQAYALLKRPAILWNLALAEEKTGRVVDALDHFKQVAHDPSATTGDREDAQRHASGLAAKTGHVDVQAPPGASLRVDGDPVEAVTPLEEPLDVMPGHHVVEARWAEGSKSAPLDVAAGQTVHVSFGARDVAGPAGSVPPSEAAGAPVGRAAPAGAALPGAGAENEPAAVAHPQPSVARVVTTASIGGAAVVAVVVGVVLGLDSRSQANEAAGDRTQIARGTALGNSACYVAPVQGACPGLSDAVRAQNRDAEASDVLYVTGGVLAVGAVAAWFLWPRSRTETGVWVSPAAGASGLGVQAGGRF
jgi:hypothetical protein